MDPIKFSTDVSDITVTSPIEVTAPSEVLSFVFHIVDANTFEVVEFGVKIQNKLCIEELDKYKLQFVAHKTANELARLVVEAGEKEGKRFQFIKRDEMMDQDNVHHVLDHYNHSLAHSIFSCINVPYDGVNSGAMVNSITKDGKNTVESIVLSGSHHALISLIACKTHAQNVSSRWSPHGVGLGDISLLGQAFVVCISLSRNARMPRNKQSMWSDHINREVTQREIMNIIRSTMPWLKIHANEGIISFYQGVGHKNISNDGQRTRRYKVDAAN